MSNGWIYDFLATHLPEEEMKQVETFLYTESWASPAARKRNWPDTKEEIPLRFHLDIDMKV